MVNSIGVWFPMVRTGTGTDSFTLRLVEALNLRRVRAEISNLPPSAEYLPWMTRLSNVPDWANLVHVNSALHSRFLPKGLPMVATVHLCVHDPALSPYKDVLRRLYHHFWIRRCESSVLRRADVVTAVSTYTAHRTKDVFRRDNIQTIHNWTDLSKFKSDFRATPHEPFRLLFMGKPSRRKGMDLLLPIMHELGPQYELRYTGVASDLVSDGTLPDNIFALGRLTTEQDVINTYLSCDALLFPSRLEGCPLAVLEAQACGRPVICADASSLQEVVAHGTSGYLCPVDNIAAFAEAARRLRDHPDVWQRMAHAARRYAEENFDEGYAVDRYISIYENILARLSAPDQTAEGQ